MPSARHEIVFCNRPNVGARELHERLRAARDPHEFDLERIRRVDLNHRTMISLAQPMLGEVSLENNAVEFADAHGAAAG